MHHESILPLQPEPASRSVSPAGKSGVCQWSGALLLLAKPGIVTAELAAALAGMLLASSSLPAGALFLWTGIAVGLAASGAAMANSLIDATSDRLMPRLTARCRALALVGAKRLLVVATISMAASLVLAASQLNLLTALLLGVAMFTYIYLYTARQKRTSPLAVLVGGIPGALPPLVGAAAAGNLGAAPLLLALVIYCWQLPHFWFLALQYRDQYQQASVPVFPLVYGEPLTKRLILAGTALLIPLGLSFRLLGSSSPLGSLVLLLAGVALLVCSGRALRQRSRYRQGFLASLIYLLLLLVTLVTDAAVRLPWPLVGDRLP